VVNKVVKSNILGYPVFLENTNFVDVPEEFHKYLPQNVEKPISSYPYAYSAFLIYYNYEAKGKKVNGVVYSDRLFEQNYYRYNRLCLKYFKDTSLLWHEREPEKVEAWLSDYFEKPVTLIAIVRDCHTSNGNHLCVFFYCEKKVKE
jgi:hypothetical protein